MGEFLPYWEFIYSTYRLRCTNAPLACAALVLAPFPDGPCAALLVPASYAAMATLQRAGAPRSIKSTTGAERCISGLLRGPGTTSIRLLLR